MRKDWIVWLGCISLFATGVIWGAIPKGDLLKLDSLHDWAETLAAIATIIGVVLAIAGYSAWKTQLVATSSHDLARRAAIALHQYKQSTLRGCMVARHLVIRMRHEVGKEGTAEFVLNEIRKDLKALEEASSEFRSMALECKVIWGDWIWHEFEKAFVISDRYSTCVDGFLRWSRQEFSDSFREEIATDVIEVFDDLAQWIGSSDQAVGSHLDKLFEPIYLEIEENLIRSRRR